MKRITGVFIAAALTAFGAVSFASTLSLPEAFGKARNTVALEDVRQHADQLFAKIDIDRDGALSIDEYASQAVVIASLARFNGAVAIDGRETFHISLPAQLPTLNVVEQTAIDAVARNEFYRISGDDASLSRNEWVAAHLAQFAAVDFNEDGSLRGTELEVFALNVARHHLSNS